MQLGQLLDTDMVPPAVMRHHVQVGGKTYALGTLIYFVPDVRVLTRLGPQVPTFTSRFHTYDSTMNPTIGLRIYKVKYNNCFVQQMFVTLIMLFYFYLFSIIAFVFEIITK